MNLSKYNKNTYLLTFYLYEILIVYINIYLYKLYIK